VTALHYQARDLLRMPKDQLWALPDRKLTIAFDDGELRASRESTIFSVYCWPLFRRYPKTPILIRHHYGNRQFNGNVMLDMINTVLWDCHDVTRNGINMEEASAIVGDTINQLYNDLTYQLEAHVRTLSILDILEMTQHPKIIEANQSVKPNFRSIEQVQKRIETLIRDPAVFPKNKIAVGTRIGVYKAGQVVQSVGPRGYLTDIDNNIFRTPILKGFAEGFRLLIELIQESRSASKSLGDTEKPLQESQYFNRQLQLLADTITDLLPGDCGTKETLPWVVMPEQAAAFDGKYYVQDGKLRRFIASSAAMEGLIGRELRFRSVMFCRHPHPRGVCETCYGELRHAVPAATIPGHVASTKLGERISQSVLSTKHLMRSASAGGLDIPEAYQPYIRNLPEVNGIGLADGLNPQKIILTIDSNEAGRLSDVMYVEDIEMLQASLVSAISRVQFTIKRSKGEENHIIPVSSGKRMPSLSKEFLHYIKQHNWTLNANGNYSINLKDWSPELPLFTLPLKNTNMLDYMNSIKAFLTGVKSATAAKSIRDCTSREEALRELYAIVSAQMQVNIVYLEFMILACMIRSAENHDYRLPLAGNVPIFGKFATAIAGRSMAPALAYEAQRNILNAPQTYLIKYRPNHPLDPIVVTGT